MKVCLLESYFLPRISDKTMIFILQNTYFVSYVGFFCFPLLNKICVLEPFMQVPPSTLVSFTQEEEVQNIVRHQREMLGSRQSWDDPEAL